MGWDGMDKADFDEFLTAAYTGREMKALSGILG